VWASSLLFGGSGAQRLGEASEGSISTMITRTGVRTGAWLRTCAMICTDGRAARPYPSPVLPAARGACHRCYLPSILLVACPTCCKSPPVACRYQWPTLLAGCLFDGRMSLLSAAFRELGRRYSQIPDGYPARPGIHFLRRRPERKFSRAERAATAASSCARVRGAPGQSTRPLRTP